MLALNAMPREDRLQAEDAKRRSNEIDEQLRLEAIALKKRRSKERKILLLGQSESGKSTLLKQFRLLDSNGKVFDAERASWRLIIFHNLVRSILKLLEEITQPVFSNKDYTDNDAFWEANSTTFKTLRVRLSPLSQIADLIANRLAPENSSPTASSPAEAASDWTSTANPHIPSSEISVLSSSRWKCALQKLHVGSRSPRPSVDCSIDFDNENDPGRLLVAFHEDLVEFCQTNSVWEMLKRRKVRVENMKIFLDDIDRITQPRYIPTFDQVLAEDTTVNRLEDSLIMWRDLCKNKILAGASIVLFLNKCDLLQAKLEAGIRLNRFLVSYGDRPNDYASVTKHLKGKFDKIKREHCPETQTYTHFITATDRETTSIAINAVRDKIMRENLQNIGFVH
ncbi:hypothetical protein RSAG8_06959, partial [Rhizoctonia solani AG-8 WAC10335]